MTSSSTIFEEHPIVQDICSRTGVLVRSVIQETVFDGNYERTKGFVKKLRKHCQEPVCLARSAKAYLLLPEVNKQLGIKRYLKSKNGNLITEHIALTCYCYLPAKKPESKTRVEKAGKRILLTDDELTDFPGLSATNITKPRYVLNYSPSGELMNVQLVIVDTGRASHKTIVSNAKKEVQKRFRAEPLSSRAAFEDVVIRDQRFCIVVVTNSEGKAKSIEQEFELNKHELETAWEHISFDVIYHEYYAELCPALN